MRTRKARRDHITSRPARRPDTLHIELLPLASKPLAEALELALIEDYRYRLKDRPPLNASSGKPTKTTHWLTAQNLPPRDHEGWLNLHPVLRGARLIEGDQPSGPRA